MTRACTVAVPPPEGLSRRARRFVGAHGIRVAATEIEPLRPKWLAHGIPGEVVDRVSAFQERWGGLVLPPAPAYDGGPRFFDADTPEGSAEEGWWFSAGDERVSLPYGFVIGPFGEFGIHGDRWTPLHSDVGGWVESLALADHAARWAASITQVTGEAVDELDLEAYTPVPEVRGLADQWWRGTDSLVAVHRGEADCFDAPQCQTAHIYAGLDDWGLRGG